MLYSTRYGFSLQHSSPLVPNPQSLHSFARASNEPTHDEHREHSSPFEPNPQSPQSTPSVSVEPTQFPHTAQSFSRLPNPQSLQSFAVKSAWPTHCPHLDMTRMDDGRVCAMMECAELFPTWQKQLRCGLRLLPWFL